MGSKQYELLLPELTQKMCKPLEQAIINAALLSLMDKKYINLQHYQHGLQELCIPLSDSIDIL